MFAPGGSSSMRLTVRPWRQVRVFTDNFGPESYFELLWEVVRPWRAQQPKASYFLSRDRSRLFPPITTIAGRSFV